MGYISRKYQVDLKPGQEKTVTINLSANPQLAEYLEIRKSYYLQSGLLTGAGLIAAVLGFYVHSSAEEYDDKGDELHSLYIRKVIMDDLNSIKSESMDNYRSARNRRLIGYGLWTAATAAVAAGIVTWYFTPENPYEVDQGFQFDFKF